MASPDPGDTPERRRMRLLYIPAVLFAAVSITVFVLAERHPAQPELKAAAAEKIALGDPAQGQQRFASTCAGCHGPNGSGGGIGPKLAGSGLSLGVVKATIDAGNAVMPAGLVKGEDEEAVLAYLSTILQGE
ncbi:MAG: c-type cytochrome [Gaiellaceae bacterium]